MGIELLLGRKTFIKKIKVHKIPPGIEAPANFLASFARLFITFSLELISTKIEQNNSVNQLRQIFHENKKGRIEIQPAIIQFL